MSYYRDTIPGSAPLTLLLLAFILLLQLVFG